MIEKRLVFLFPGFEPLRAEAQVERFHRAAKRSADVWNAELVLGSPDTGSTKTAPFAVFHAVLAGSGYKTETDIVVCDWSDLIRAYAARPVITRFVTGLVALGDFLLTGTVFRYLRTSWRYGFFYAFPLAMLLFALVPALLVFSWLAGLAPGALGVLAGLAGGGCVALALLWWVNRRLHLLTALDDWAMARDFCRGRNPLILARIERQASEIRRRSDASDAQEVVIAAHSLGASLAILAVDRAIRDGLAAERLHIFTVGSSLLKTALHPAASDQREAVERLVVDRRLPWTDCQGLSDPINFYKSNPATSLGIMDGRTPIVVRIRFKHLVKAATYQRIKRDFFRLHRQFVLAVEQRCAYSFHMLLLGPRPLVDFAETGTVGLPPLAGDAPVTPDRAPPLAAAGGAR
ncbi:hypothetical protein [Aurantimonas endophytica]|uniref:Lipase (Class 3) n=1 Tax=Aurantimonas endophytica TaxID=1522175 RepID=A0A7W6MQ70_9HYPH|nr:hypothetical protein [Aurantimonas endophytica]MBB4003765.1 hypothetical protein [Aurantimonas endophytica]MCO6404620.1 hypothetical protein [Aurantimonas endophytica]